MSTVGLVPFGGSRCRVTLVIFDLWDKAGLNGRFRGLGMERHHFISPIWALCTDLGAEDRCQLLVGIVPQRALSLRR